MSESQRSLYSFFDYVYHVFPVVILNILDDYEPHILGFARILGGNFGDQKTKNDDIDRTLYGIDRTLLHLEFILRTKIKKKIKIKSTRNSKKKKRKKKENQGQREMETQKKIQNKDTLTKENGTKYKERFYYGPSIKLFFDVQTSCLRFIGISSTVTFSITPLCERIHVAGNTKGPRTHNPRTQHNKYKFLWETVPNYWIIAISYHIYGGWDYDYNFPHFKIIYGTR